MLSLEVPVTSEGQLREGLQPAGCRDGGLIEEGGFLLPAFEPFIRNTRTVGLERRRGSHACPGKQATRRSTEAPPGPKWPCRDPGVEAAFSGRESTRSESARSCSRSDPRQTR